MFFANKKRIFQLLFILLWALWLTACGELEFGVAEEGSNQPVAVTVVTTVVASIPEGMVLVTVTPPEQPTATAFAGTLATTATPTAVVDQATAPPMTGATAVPTSTPTPTPYVALPLPSSPTPPYPEILTYPTVGTMGQPGGDVTIDYRTRADAVRLCLAPVFTQAWDCQPAPESGPYTVNIPASTKTNLQLRLLATRNGSEIEGTAIVMLNCSKSEWFFSGPPITCPGGPPVETAAAYQRFERGVMLWLEDGHWWEDGSVIYVLYDDPNQNFEAFHDQTLPPDDAPVPNNEYDPPNGLLVPESGFGLLWRENSWIRQKLGWALAPEVAYTATIQREYSENRAVIYLTDVDARLLVLSLFTNNWSERSQP